MRKEVVKNVEKLSKGDKLKPWCDNIESPFSCVTTNKKGELVNNLYIFVGVNNGSVTLRNIKGQLESYSIKDVESGYLEKVYVWSPWRSVPTDYNALYKTNRKRIWFKKGNIKVKADCNFKAGDTFNLAEGLKVCEEKYKKKINEINNNSLRFSPYIDTDKKLSEAEEKGLCIEEIRGNLTKAPIYCHLAFCMNTDYKIRSFLTDFLNKYYYFEESMKKGYGYRTSYKARNDKKVFIAFNNLFGLVTSNPHEKATYNNLYESLYEMFYYCLENKIEYIAMPKIGCGQNGLEWEKVKETIEDAYVEAYNESKSSWDKTNEEFNPFVNIMVYDYSL